MLILGTSKDYYDYVVKNRGVDSYVVFNRGKTLDFPHFHEWVIEEAGLYESKQSWLLLVGLKAYVFQYDILLRTNSLHCVYDVPDRSIIKTYNNVKIDKPVYANFCRINHVKVGRKYKYSVTGIFSNDIYCVSFNNRRSKWEKPKKHPPYLENPNLKLLRIPALIPAEEIWDNIYNYLLRQKEPPDPLPVPDELKLHSHGFDNASFKGKLTGRKARKNKKEIL